MGTASRPGYIRHISLLSSLGLHVLCLVLGRAVFVEQASYGIRQGIGSVEVSLEGGALLEDEFKKPPLEEEKLPEFVEPVLDRKPRPQAKPRNEASISKITSAQLGSASSSPDRGALTQASPNYLQNPPPVYPATARRKGWEGLSLLRVVVDRLGNPDNIRLEQSSGYEVLDRAALRAVQVWRFRPARIGPHEVESTVLVPIRFKLEQRA